jgi:hypothetical protein
MDRSNGELLNLAAMHTCLTAGNTHDLPSSCLYAPTPRSTFLESLSARYVTLSPNSTSGGARGTLARE